MRDSRSGKAETAFRDGSFLHYRKFLLLEKGRKKEGGERKVQ
jgi:hypothetical protein